MSNIKSIVFFALGALALLGVHVALSYCGVRDAQIVRRTTLIDPTFRVTALSVSRKGEPVTRLRRLPEWRLVSPFSGSVDEQVVMRVLDALTFAPLEDAVTDEALLGRGRSRSDFGLDEPDLSIGLSDGGGEKTVDFGTLTPSSNGVYVAVSGSAAVFVVPAEVRKAVDLPADRFRRRTLFKIGPDSVSGFSVKRGTGTPLGFVRDGELWNVGDERASATKVKALLSEVLTAEAVDFVWPTGVTNEAQSATASRLAVYELDPESAVTMTMKCVDGKDRQVSFGGDAGDGRVFALIQNGGAIVTVDSKLRDLAWQDAKMFTDSRLFPFDANTVSSFTISDAKADYVLARGAEGAWRIDAPVVAVADSACVTAILDKLLSLSAADIRSVGLKVGVSTNADAVVVSPESALGGLRLEDLRSKEILKIDPVLVKRIVSVRRQDKGKPSSVVYGRERRAWNVEAGGRSGSVDEKGVEAVLEAINPLRAVRIEKLKVSPDDLARYGLEEPFATIAIDQDREDAVRRNILIGDETAGGRFATVGTADAVFVLSSQVVDGLTGGIITDAERNHGM